MERIKFLTVFDDAFALVLNENALKLYDISLIPACYSCDNKFYFDAVNSDAESFAGHRRSGLPFEPPQISPEAIVFLLKINNMRAYDTVFILCPNSAWYPYYQNVKAAVDRYVRCKDFPGKDVYTIHVVDTKNFASGVLLDTLRLSMEYMDTRCSSRLLEYRCKNFLKSNRTCILTKSETAFCQKDELCAHLFQGDHIQKLDISESADEVRYDRFSEVICRMLKKNGGKYAVSVGYACEFAGNIIGRIERRMGFSPICTSQYAIPSTAVLGENTMAVHLL